MAKDLRQEREELHLKAFNDLQNVYAPDLRPHESMLDTDEKILIAQGTGKVFRLLLESYGRGASAMLVAEVEESAAKKANDEYHARLAAQGKTCGTCGEGAKAGK
jgi:hypothetical protein